MNYHIIVLYALMFVKLNALLYTSRIFFIRNIKKKIFVKNIIMAQSHVCILNTISLAKKKKD